MAKITYTDKVTLNTNLEIADINKGKAADFNEIKTVVNGLDDINITGWYPIIATLTYTSADTPTFVAGTSIDLTGIISVGMKLKLTQTTVKYFIVTAITSTTITLYGGTDYTISATAITEIYYSHSKSPLGFPLDADKWSVIFTDSTNLTVTSPAQNSYNNIGGKSIIMPIGKWEIIGSAICFVDTATAATVNFDYFLSTSATSSVNKIPLGYVESKSVIDIVMGQTTSNKYVSAVAKTTYYLMARTTVAGMSRLLLYGTFQDTIIKFKCAYL